MSEEMIQAAYALQKAANNYKEIYIKEKKNDPVIWLKNNKTGESVFIADKFNSETMIKNMVG